MNSPAQWSLFLIAEIWCRMFFVKTRNSQIAIVITALVAFFPGSYMAQGATTTNLTFVVNPFLGGLSINVPAAGNLGSLASPDTVTATTGQLDTVTVTDTRRGTLVRGWTAFAISTDLLTGTDSLTASTIGYSAGTPTIVSGIAGVTENTKWSLLTTTAVNTANTTTGNHVVSWRPTITITLKNQQVAGTYVGTMTHSVA
jgi:hypothetical protein